MESKVIKKNARGRAAKINAVEIVAESLREALIDSDEKQLQKLLSEDLTYGHSDGFVEGKTSFIANITTGKYDFVSVRISNQSVGLFGKTAIVRHLLDADTNDDNSPGQVNLAILQVWRREKQKWRLLARQAVKVSGDM